MMRSIVINDQELSPGMKISFIPNPKRSGYKAYDRYEKYQKAKTIEEYFDICERGKIEKRYWRHDFRHDLKKGFLKIVENHLADIPRFKIYGEDDPEFESRVQPKLSLRSWEDLARKEKLIALRELINNGWLLEDSENVVLEVILDLNDRFLRNLPGKKLHNAASHQESEAAYKDFRNIFLDGSSDMVFYMLSVFADYHINNIKAETWEDNEFRERIVDREFGNFDELADCLNHIFEQFCVNILVTRNGFVPRQDNKIDKEVYEPTLKVLSGLKWRLVSDHLSDMFNDYQAQNYPEVITKAHSVLQGFLQIIIGVEGKNGKGEVGKLFGLAKQKGIISDNSVAQAVTKGIQSFMSNERANNSTAKPTLQQTNSSDALLVMNVLMVFLQHCLHNMGIK